MKTKHKYVVIIILLITLFLMFPFPINNNLNKRTKLLEQYKKIENIIKKYKLENNNKIIIKDGKIKTNKNIQVKLDENIDGQFIRVNNNLYGQIQKDNYCIKKKYNNEINITKSLCTDIDEPANITEKIISTASEKELIDDNTNTGLDSKYPFSSRKYYIGSNPNNYIIFMDKCWRIVNIAQNNNVKLIYEGETKDNTCTNITSNISGNIGLNTWDKFLNEKGNWNKQSTLRTNMLYWIKDGSIDLKDFKMNLDLDKIANADWYIGNVNIDNSSLLDDINDERNEIDKLQLGLPNNSDYLKVSCYTSSSNSLAKCNKNNYLYKSKYHWWTINYVNDNTKSVWIVMQDGTIQNIPIKLSNEYYFSGTRLSLYLNSDVKIIGLGTEKNPYIVVD